MAQSLDSRSYQDMQINKVFLYLKLAEKILSSKA